MKQRARASARDETASPHRQHKTTRFAGRANKKTSFLCRSTKHIIERLISACFVADTSMNFPQTRALRAASTKRRTISLRQPSKFRVTRTNLLLLETLGHPLTLFDDDVGSFFVGIIFRCACEFSGQPVLRLRVLPLKKSRFIG